MKTISIYDQTITAYQPKDLERLRKHGDEASELWYSEWHKQGSNDNGTCCGGKAIRVWYLDKGKRIPTEKAIVRCTWVQGNTSASQSVKPALDYLKAQGIEAEYYDGWMD